MLPVGLCAQIACVWEATARKPGNVHRFCDFADTSYVDFLLSAAAIAPVLETGAGGRVGETVLEGVRATRQVVASNTNLGVLLLLAPLAAVPRHEDLQAGLEHVLDSLDVADARAVFEAIRLAQPAGLVRVAEEDVAGEPTKTLREVMALAAERDLIARQYANGFREVLEVGVPSLRRGVARTGSVESAVVLCHLELMAAHPDSLIARKRGPAAAAESARRARRVLDAGWPDEPGGRRALAELDAWLRADGNARNPGTTADIVAACLFVCLRGDILKPSDPFPSPIGFDHG
jgi:triphosphoribosyl-dephospho-CoA synthase